MSLSMLFEPRHGVMSGRARLLALLAVASLLASALGVIASAPAAANPPIFTVGAPSGGDGSTSATAIVHEIGIDCSRFPQTSDGWPADANDWNRMVSLPGSFEPGKYYTLRLTVTKASTGFPGSGGVLAGCTSVQFGTFGLDPEVNETYQPSAYDADGAVIEQTFLVAFGSGGIQSGNARFQVIWDDYSSGSREFRGAFFLANAFADSGGGPPGGGGGMGPCVMPPVPLTSYTTPELWAAICEGWLQDSDGTLVLPAGLTTETLEHRLTVPAGVSSIEITTTGSMRYLAAIRVPSAFPTACGLVMGPTPLPGPVTSTVTGFEGTTSCVITLGGATASPTMAIIIGRILVPDAGSFTLTYTLRDGSTTIDTFPYTIVGSGGSSGGTTGGSATATATPAAADVATAVALSAAAGVEGTSSALMVLNGAVVPVSSSIAAGAGPRGGVVLEAEGLKVTVASAVGARPGAGVVVPEGGAMECTLCGGFVPGSVVEVWVNSDPRLTAAVRIPDDASSGDCHLLAIPTGAPLDGRGPIEAGAHTLQLQMYTDSGFAVLSTGITIGGVSPGRVPAGDGSMPIPGPLGGMLVLLIGAAGVGLAAARRQVVND
jgi:hypothetical protein